MVSLLAAPILVKYEGFSITKTVIGLLLFAIVAISVMYSKKGGFKKQSAADKQSDAAF